MRGKLITNCFFCSGTHYSRPKFTGEKNEFWNRVRLRQEHDIIIDSGEIGVHVNDQDNKLRWLGVNEDVTVHLIEYISNPRTLYHLSMTSKSIRRSLTVDIVVKCAMYHGGRPFATVFKLANLMKMKSIYPPSALRILRLVNGKCCEFCFNVKVEKKDVIGTLIDDREYRNARPNEMRGNFPIYACYTCLTRMRNPTISKKWEYPCLTRRWEKTMYSTQTRKHYIKQHYLANREIYYKIFQHDRVVSVPYGVRFFTNSYNANEDDYSDSDNDENVSPSGRNLVPTTNIYDYDTTQRDRFEIMAAGIIREHGTGDIIGPLINIKNLKQLVLFSKQRPSVDIETNVETFIKTMIPNTPVLESYLCFTRIFDANRSNAVRWYCYLRVKKREEEHLARLRKIENVVEAIADITFCVSVRLIKKAYTSAGLNEEVFSSDMMELDVNIIKRLLLCYREESLLHHPTYVVSYDTGTYCLDARLHKIMKHVFSAPTGIIKTKKKAYKVAFNVAREMIMIWGPPHLSNIPAVVRKGVVMEGFRKEYRPKMRRTCNSSWHGWEAKKWRQYSTRAYPQRRFM